MQYSPVDRTNINLPVTHTCEECNILKSSGDFELKKRNQHTPEGVYKLKDVCIACEQLVKEGRKGTMMKQLQEGERIVSDRLLTLVTANNNYHLDNILNRFIAMVSSSTDAGDFKLLISTLQGGNPIMHIASKSLEPPAAPVVPVNDSGSLLSRLKANN